MSRIIVKQLPKNITEEKLRNLFGTIGTITDIQLKYTPDGKFRQFCFVGYRSEDEAQAAISHFNNSCIQTSRIKVEVSAALGAGDKPQSWSKHSKDSKHAQTDDKSKGDIKKEAKDKSKKETKLDEIIGVHKNDPEFQAFLKAHDKKRTLWANDDLITNNNEIDKEPIEQSNKKKDATAADNLDEHDDDDDYDNSDDGDDDGDDNDDGDVDVAAEKSGSKLASKSISDLEYMQSLMGKQTTEKSEKPATTGSIDLFTIKIHDIPFKIKRQDILKFFKPLKPYSVRLPSKVHGFCYVGFKTEKEMSKAMLKDKSFIRGKQVFFSDFTEKNKISKSKLKGGNESVVNVKNTPSNTKWSKQVDGIRNEEDISESGRIYFRNLAYTITEDDLQQAFEKFGPVAEIHLPVDTITRQIKGFGTVAFMMPEHAMQAFNELDGSNFHGRLLHLMPAKIRDGDGSEDVDENNAALTFKQKKLLKLKKTAQQPVSWNTLFLGANAVADLLAKKYDSTKEKILDTHEGGSSAAVRIALGETQIVIEMKKFLEENGVSLKAFEVSTSAAKRSKTIVLAKNLPAETTVGELTPIFAKFGPIGRIVLPPSGVTAIIEYCDPSEARQAFKKLAYSKFKNAPLFLEWAPENLFITTPSGEQIPKHQNADDTTTATSTDANTEKPLNEDEVTECEADIANEPPEPNTTLFFRNLNFQTVPETVRNHFKHLGEIHTVEIVKRKDPENPRIMNSLGYGFIQFKKSETAEKALKRLQLTNIEGNVVELKRSDRTLNTSTTSTRKTTAVTKQTGTKILVRNIPFQAKFNEIRDIFKAFGELRTLRLPKKMTPGVEELRGFGFVDYLTKSDAKKAFEALSQSTHLYGRRLVLEWAKTDTDDDVNDLRKRTAQQYHSVGASAKRGKAVFDVDGTVEAATYGDEEE